jgi:hypothetical protein
VADFAEVAAGHRSNVYIRLQETVVKPNCADWEDSWCCLAGFRPLITKTQEQDVALFAHHFDREGAEA